MKFRNIFFFAVITIVFFTNSTYSQVTLTLPNASGLPNTEVTVPITVSDLTGLNITSFQFQINFDNAVIDINQVTSSGTLTAGSTPTSNATTTNKSHLRVAWASATPLAGSGTLFNIRIRFKSTGTTALTYTLTDGGFTSAFGKPTDNITVTPVNGSATISTTNNPPYFDTVSDKTIKAGQTLSFTVNATDPEGQTLVYTASNLPSGANFNAGTKTFAWTPIESQVGDYNVIFSASDGTNSVAITVKITVTSSNTAPEFNDIEDQSVNEGENLTFQVTAVDAEGDALVYSASNLPQGASFSPSTRIFEWTPMFGQAGTYNINFSVTDGKEVVTMTVKITVISMNTAPIFSVFMSTQTVHVHNVPVEFTFQYEAYDAEGDELTFSLILGPAGSSMTPSGLFSWTPTEAQAGKSFLVSVRVSDGSLNTTSNATITTPSEIVSVGGVDELPSNYVLYQNYPNPFNPETIIEYAVSESAFITIKVFDSLGQEISTLVNGYKPSGYYKVNFNAQNLRSGIYYYQMSAENYVSVKKMLVLK